MGKGILSRAGAEAADRFDLPAELAYGGPQMELMGQRRFVMAGHKGVLSYSGELVEISGGSLVHQFTRIGAHCMIQGGSKINKDIPPFSIVGREPISYCGINSVGLRRRNFTAEQIHNIQDVYRYLYLSGKNVSEALESIKNELPETPEREMIINFVSASERGIVKGII